MKKRVMCIIGISVVIGFLLFLCLPSYSALDDVEEHTPESSLSATWTLEEPESKVAQGYILSLPVPAFSPQLAISETLVV